MKKKMKTVATFCVSFIILAAFAQQLDKFTGRWKQVEGSIQIEIGKDSGKGRYTTKLIIDSVVSSSTGVHILDGGLIPVQFPPLEDDPVKLKYDEKNRTLSGYWPAKNKTLKFVQY